MPVKYKGILIIFLIMYILTTLEFLTGIRLGNGQTPAERVDIESGHVYSGYVQGKSIGFSRIDEQGVK